MRLFLIGMRGAGKTTVGTLVAQKLQKPFFDCDVCIKKEVGVTITQLVATKGWDSFRDIESSVLNTLISDHPDMVCATGGGVILRESHRELLRGAGLVIYLAAPVAVLEEHIRGDTDRPHLTNALTMSEELSVVLRERGELYRNTAHAIVSVGGKTPEVLASEVLALYHTHITPQSI